MAQRKKGQTKAQEVEKTEEVVDTQVTDEVVEETADDSQEQASDVKTEEQKQIEALEAEKEEYLCALQRERADFENYKKRNATLASDSFQNGVADTASAILPVLDNFERALTAECADQAFAEGVSMIKRQLEETLGNLGVKEISADGQFDPELHNAVMQVEDEKCGTNEIVEVLQKGYIINDKVLRYTMVKVAK